MEHGLWLDGVWFGLFRIRFVDDMYICGLYKLQYAWDALTNLQNLFPKHQFTKAILNVNNSMRWNSFPQNVATMGAIRLIK